MRTTWRDYWDLTKPKVVALIVFTALVGMCLAIPGLPTTAQVVTGLLGGLTTFSTFSAEVVFLLQQGRVSWALLNVAVNLLGSFAMTAVAFWLFSQAASR